MWFNLSSFTGMMFVYDTDDDWVMYLVTGVRSNKDGTEQVLCGNKSFISRTSADVG